MEARRYAKKSTDDITGQRGKRKEMYALSKWMGCGVSLSLDALRPGTDRQRYQPGAPARLHAAHPIPTPHDGRKGDFEILWLVIPRGEQPRVREHGFDRRVFRVSVRWRSGVFGLCSHGCRRDRVGTRRYGVGVPWCGNTWAVDERPAASMEHRRMSEAARARQNCRLRRKV